MGWLRFQGQKHVYWMLCLVSISIVVDSGADRLLERYFWGISFFGSCNCFHIQTQDTLWQLACYHISILQLFVYIDFCHVNGGTHSLGDDI